MQAWVHLARELCRCCVYDADSVNLASFGSVFKEVGLRAKDRGVERTSAGGQSRQTGGSVVNDNAEWLVIISALK
jgi:hypothetical protein